MSSLKGTIPRKVVEGRDLLDGNEEVLVNNQEVVHEGGTENRRVFEGRRAMRMDLVKREQPQKALGHLRLGLSRGCRGDLEDRLSLVCAILRDDFETTPETKIYILEIFDKKEYNKIIIKLLIK